MNQSSKFLILRELPIFKALDDLQITQLCNQSGFQKAKKGSFLYNTGDPINYVYLIYNGSVKIGMHTTEDRTLIKEIAYKNEMIGENIFAGHTERREFSQALESTEYFKIPSVYFKSLLERNPEMCQQLTQVLIHKMANLELRMNNFVFKKAQSRITDFLMSLAKTKGIKIGIDEILVNHGLSHKEIAYITDTSRQTVARVLGELKRKNIIHFSTRKPHKILIRSALSIS
jgi:CRP-like cAMP-binding protein